MGTSSMCNANIKNDGDDDNLKNNSKQTKKLNITINSGGDSQFWGGGWFPVFSLQKVLVHTCCPVKKRKRRKEEEEGRRTRRRRGGGRRRRNDINSLALLRFKIQKCWGGTEPSVFSVSFCRS